MDRHIVPVEPASGRGDTVLIQVQLENPTTSQLDLRLVGCEGESPYVASIKHRDLHRLQLKFKGSDAEWESILSHFLLQRELDTDTNTAALLQGVRMVYVLNNATLKLSIRQDVQGIKVTLGEIDMPIDEDFEFNPFEWAQTSARAHASALQQLVTLKARVRSEQETAAKLHAQLEEFIRTKNDTETAMLEQFMELLNLKKHKIRDQSRLLAAAKVDESTASAVQASRIDSKARKPGTSRASKRKAPGKATKADSDSDPMDVDTGKVEEESDEDMVRDRAATPDRESDDETESEDEVGGNVRRDMSSETARSTSAVARATKEEAPASNGPPPIRSLPFGRAVTRGMAPKKQPSPPADDDETEDEEL